MSSNEYFEGLKVRLRHDLDSCPEMAVSRPNRRENTYDIQGRQAKYRISLRLNISKLRCPQPCSNRSQVVESYGSDPVVVGGGGGGRLHIFKGLTLRRMSAVDDLYRVRTLTSSLLATTSRRAAAGHSGQYRTVSKSDSNVSRIARYSVSLAVLVPLPFPALRR